MTEYIAGVETVKTLQFEPVLERRFGDYLASYLAAGFTTRQLATSYNVVANALEQLMTIAVLLVGALTFIPALALGSLQARPCQSLNVVPKTTLYGMTCGPSSEAPSRVPKICPEKNRRKPGNCEATATRRVCARVYR